MPDLNGLDFIRSLISHPLVIFTTAYSEYAVDGFKLDAVDYLFFDAYERADKLYMLKRLNEETVLIGDNFSPRFACVMNHFAS